MQELQDKITLIQSSKPDSVKDHLELRLQETLEEAKRHYQNYTSMRDEHNRFLESRLNKLVEVCLQNDN